MNISSHGRRLTRATAMTLALLLASALPVAAQSTDQQPSAQQPTMGGEELSQQQLESFVAAAERVGEITGELQAQAQGIEDEAELAELQVSANEQMVAAVEEEGLSVEEYNRIFQMAQADPELNATLREMLTQ